MTVYGFRKPALLSGAALTSGTSLAFADTLATEMATKSVAAFRAARLEDILPPERHDPADLRATFLACVALVGFLALAILGLAALIGAIGFGVWRMWS